MLCTTVRVKCHVFAVSLYTAARITQIEPELFQQVSIQTRPYNSIASWQQCSSTLKAKFEKVVLSISPRILVYTLHYNILYFHIFFSSRFTSLVLRRDQTRLATANEVWIGFI